MEKPIVNINATGITREYDAQYKIKVLKANIPFVDQVTDENTKYVIRWDFDLDGEEIEIPANCILQFEGGSLSNGTVIFDNTELLGTPKILCDFDGDIVNSNIDISYFGAKGDGVFDNSSIIQKLLNIYGDKDLVIPTGVFAIKNQITTERNLHLKGKSKNSVLFIDYEGYGFRVVKNQEIVNQYVTVEVSGLTVKGRYANYYDTQVTTESSFFINDVGTYSYRSIFTDTIFTNLKVCLNLQQAYWTRIHQCVFTNGNMGVRLTAANSTSITNNIFRYFKDRGLVIAPLIKLNGTYENETQGCNISGNDFSTLDYCGLHIVGAYQNGTIIGNYFEADNENHVGRQIIIGDITHDGNYTSDIVTNVRKCLVIGNSGLWDDVRKGIENYADFSNNNSNAVVYFKEGSSGDGNIGSNADYSEKVIDKYAYLYETSYKRTYTKGIRNSILVAARTIHYDSVCIPAGGSVTIGRDIAKRLFKLVDFKLNNFLDITLSVTTTNETLIESLRSRDDGLDVFEQTAYTFDTIKNINFVLTNNTNKSAITEVYIKYINKVY